MRPNDRFVAFSLVLYSVHNRLTLLHKYTSTKRWPEFTRVDSTSRDKMTCNTTCVEDNSRYPTGLSANYSLTQFTCILFLFLEYICFSVYLFVFPMSFFYQHHNTVIIFNHSHSEYYGNNRNCHLESFHPYIETSMISWTLV